ncbi:cytochrome P450 [Streptomyces sp. NPDC090493]|uniref:cytochrome P450 n=1 Tax=Streptomyces sp. NPDC090493 TaxID=3365964 RepID=UPI0037FF5613
MAWPPGLRTESPHGSIRPSCAAARPGHAFKPFGTGERVCVGRRFALHEATVLLAVLVHRYRPRERADYALTVKETLTLKPEGFTLTPCTPADRVHPPLPGARPTAAHDPHPTTALPARVRHRRPPRSVTAGPGEIPTNG